MAAHVPECWTNTSCRKSPADCKTVPMDLGSRPGGTIEETESLLTTSPNYTNPKMFKAPHSARQWFRVISWLLIALSAIAFLVIMWLPSHPMWLVATVSIVFAVGVLSLFFTAGNPKHNPNLDQNVRPSDSKAMNAERGCIRWKDAAPLSHASHE